MVTVSKYYSKVVRQGTRPTNDGNAETDPLDPINPVNPSTGSRSYLTLTDTVDNTYNGKNGFVPVVTNEQGLTLQPLPQIQENGLVSGGIVQWTGSGYVFNISSAFYRIGGNPYSTDPTQKTLSTPDATNDRIDVFAVDVNNAVVVIEGTPAATPVKPQVDPATQLELTSVIVTASSTEPTLTEEVIYDENVEWTGSSSGTGTVAFNSTNDPYQGTVSIETTDIENGLKVRLTNGSDIDISTYQTIGFQIKLKEGLFAGQELNLTFLDSSGDAVSTTITIGLDKNNLSYQFVGIALNTLSFIDNNVRAIEFEFIRSRGQSVNDGYFLDIIKLEGGINPPISLNTFISLSDTPGTYSGQGGKTVAVKSDESGLEFISGGGGASTFIDLTDTPASYSGQAGLFPRVNVGETALEFDSVSPYDLDQEGATDGQVLTWVNANLRYEPVTPSGGSGLWTDATTFIYRDSPVVVGRTTLPTNATFAVQSKTANSTHKFIQFLNSSSSELVSLEESGVFRIGNPTINGTNDRGLIVKGTVSGSGKIFQVYDSLGNSRIELLGNGRFNITSDELYVGSPPTDSSDRGAVFKGSAAGIGYIFQIYDSGNTIRFRLLGNGTLILSEGGHLQVGTTTGTKIGTATTQKLGFWNATPVIQQTTSITAATFTANTSGIADNSATFDGYTIGQVVAALRLYGILA